MTFKTGTPEGEPLLNNYSIKRMNAELKEWFNNTSHDMGKTEFNSLQSIVNGLLEEKDKEIELLEDANAAGQKLMGFLTKETKSLQARNNELEKVVEFAPFINPEWLSPAEEKELQEALNNLKESKHNSIGEDK